MRRRCRAARSTCRCEREVVGALNSLGLRAERALVGFVRANAALLAATMAVALLAYGDSLVDPTLTWDEETAPTFAQLGRGNGWSISLYRWGLVAFQAVLLPGSTLPFLRPLLALVLLAAVATAYARLLPTARSAQDFFAIAFVSVPTFAYAMTFSFMCVEFVMAMLLFVLGLRCFVVATREQTVEPRMLALAVILWVLAPSFYQDYGVVLTGFLVFVFFRVAGGAELRAIREQAAWFVATLVCSLVVYGVLSLVIARGAGVGTGAYLLGYVAPDRTGAVIAQFVRRMRGFYLHPSVYGSDAIRLAALLLPLLGACTPGPPVRRASLVVLGLAIGLAPFVYGFGLVPPIRAASGLMFVVGGAAAFAVARSGERGASFAKLAVLWITLGNCVAVNNMFRYENLAWEADRLVAADVARRIHEVAPEIHDEPRVRVVFSGSYKRTLSDELPGADFWVGMFDTWGENKTLRRKRAMVLAGVPDFQLGSEQDYEASRSSFETMPSWPARGAVERHGDLVLVKLAPANGFATQ